MGSEIVSVTELNIWQHQDILQVHSWGPLDGKRRKSVAQIWIMHDQTSPSVSDGPCCRQVNNLLSYATAYVLCWFVNQVCAPTAAAIRDATCDCVQLLEVDGFDVLLMPLVLQLLCSMAITIWLTLKHLEQHSHSRQAETGTILME